MSKKQIDLRPLADIAVRTAETEGKVVTEILYFEAKKKKSVKVGLGWRMIGVNGDGKVKHLKRGILIRVGPSDVMPQHPSRGLDWETVQRELSR
jgi:hypothetical protein